MRHTSLTCAKPPFLKQDFLSVSLYAGEGEVTKSSLLGFHCFLFEISDPHTSKGLGNHFFIQKHLKLLQVF